MLVENKKNKGFYLESDASLSVKFAEAGFGFDDGGEHLFHPLEVGYLVKIGKAAIAESPESFITSQKKKDRLFPFALEAYCSVRSKGRMVRVFMKGVKYLRVYAPGVGREEERPSQLLCLLPGKLPSVKSISGEVRVAHLARLDLIIACGTEKEIKFYKISSFNF